jgi:hypothetical protein
VDPEPWDHYVLGPRGSRSVIIFVDLDPDPSINKQANKQNKKEKP